MNLRHEPWVVRGTAAAICGTLFVLSLLPRQEFLIDDALIYQSFVRSALDGHGLVYGPGNGAEGYSSPLWALLLVLIGAFGFEGLTAARVLGALTGLGTVVGVTALLPARYSWHLRSLIGALLALQAGFAWWSVSGMEGPLLMMLLAFATVSMVRGSYAGAGLCGGLLAICRPEGAMYLLPVSVWLFLRHRSDPLSRRQVAHALALLILPALSWQTYRLLVYDAIIANSALAQLSPAKTVIPREGGGAAYVLGAAGTYLGLVVPFGLALLWHAHRRRMDRFTLSCVLVVILQILLSLAVGGNWMPWHRLILPCVVPMAFVVGRLSHESRRAGLAVGLLALALSFVANVRDMKEHIPVDPTPYYARLPFSEPLRADPGAVAYARDIYCLTKPGDSVVHLDVGQSGYLADDLRVLDSFGLVSRFEAEYLHGRRDDAEARARFRELDPSLVFFLVVRGTTRPVMRVTVPFVPILEVDYKEVARRAWWGGHDMVVMVKKTADQADAPCRGNEARLERWLARARGLTFERHRIAGEQARSRSVHAARDTDDRADEGPYQPQVLPAFSFSSQALSGAK